MADATKGQRDEVAGLKNAFNNYTNAAGQSIHAKIDAAIKAKEESDDAAAAEAISGIRDVARALIANAPVPTPPNNPGNTPVESPISDLPPADSAGPVPVEGGGTGGASSV